LTEETLTVYKVVINLVRILQVVLTVFMLFELEEGMDREKDLLTVVGNSLEDDSLAICVFVGYHYTSSKKSVILAGKARNHSKETTKEQIYDIFIAKYGSDRWMVVVQVQVLVF
jgi:hypothetical protein